MPGRGNDGTSLRPKYIAILQSLRSGSPRSPRWCCLICCMALYVFGFLPSVCPSLVLCRNSKQLKIVGPTPHVPASPPRPPKVPITAPTCHIRPHNMAKNNRRTAATGIPSSSPYPMMIMKTTMMIAMLSCVHDDDEDDYDRRDDASSTPSLAIDVVVLLLLVEDGGSTSRRRLRLRLR